MHEMKLRLQVLRPASRRSRAARVELCHWPEWRHNCVGVSLQEIRATMQVMIGVSPQARWDETLVYCNGRNMYLLSHVLFVSEMFR